MITAVRRAAPQARPALCLLSLFALSAAGASAAEPARPPVQVIVTAKACEPNQLTVSAGTTTFQIINKSSRALEWEILKGVMVVDERENIAPGFTQKLTTTLEPGEYDITCGLIGNPHGKLVVTATGGSTEASAKPTATELIGPAAEYRVYLHGEMSSLATASTALSDALKAGDLATAAARYTDARTAYLHIKPVATLFGDLDGAIDATPSSDFARLANELGAGGSKDGLTAAASSLSTDVTKLQGQQKSVNATPEAMMRGAVAVIAAIAADAGNAETLNHPGELAAIRAKLDGAAKILELFQSLAVRTDKVGAEKLAAALADLQQRLARPGGDTMLSDAERKALADGLTALAGNVGKLNVTLGLSQS